MGGWDPFDIHSAAVVVPINVIAIHHRRRHHGYPYDHHHHCHRYAQLFQRIGTLGTGRAGAAGRTGHTPHLTKQTMIFKCAFCCHPFFNRLISPLNNPLNGGNAWYN